MTSPWRLADGSSPCVVWWGDECVVHHLVSNDTHRLSAPAGRLLERLCRGERVVVADDSADTLLVEALAGLGLAVPCAR